jgi:signal recognition particle subunit SRP54
MESVIGMIPGLGKLKGAIDFSEAEKEIRRTEAIINSMTPKERLYPHLLDGSRRMRIAKGSGHRVQDVNELLKRYMDTKKMIKRFTKGGMKGLPKHLFK